MGQRERSRALGLCVSLKVVCGCVAVLLALSSVESMTMDVDNQDQQCVIIAASKGSTINANYEVRASTRVLNSTPLLASTSSQF